MSARKVLIFAPYGAWMVHHQLDAVLGAALMRRGCEVLVVGCDGFLDTCFIAGKPPSAETCRNCAANGAAWFSRLGLKVRQLGEIVTPGDREEAASFAGGADLAAIASVRHGDRPLGEWSLASLQAYFSTAEFRVDDPAVAKAMRAQLSNGVLLERALTRIMDEFRPDQVFSYNGLHFYYRIALELARERGLPVLVHERGLLDDSFNLLDTETMNSNAGRFRGFEAWKEVPLTAGECEEVRRYFREREEGRNSFSRFYAFESRPENVRAALRIPGDAKVVALFASGDRELGAFESTQARTFPSQVEWIRATAAICRRHGLYLVVRHHPSNVLKGQVNHPFIGELLALARELPDCVRVIMPHEQVTSYAVLWNSDVAVTYFSTMGSETPVRGISGVCVGDSIYRPMGVQWAEDEAAYEKALLAGIERTARFGMEDLSRAYRFAHFLAFKLGYRFRSFGIRDVYGPELRIARMEDLDPGRDGLLDHVCAYVTEGGPIHPVPGHAERSRDEAEEKRFLEGELANLHARRTAARGGGMAKAAATPLVSVLAPPTGAEGPYLAASLARCREKSVERIGLAADGDTPSFMDSLIRALEASKGRYIYVASAEAEPDESMIPNSTDMLERDESGDCNAVAWGAWVVGKSGRPMGEMLTESRPAETFEEAVAYWPSLERPSGVLSLVVLRASYLRDLVPWLEVMSGFPLRQVAAAFYDLFFVKKSESIRRVQAPMVACHAGGTDRKEVPAKPAEGPEAGADSGAGAGDRFIPPPPPADDASPDELRRRLDVHVAAFSRDPRNRQAGLDCAATLVRLGHGFEARRIYRALLELNPSDAEIPKLIDAVEWGARQGAAAMAEWALRGKGYERLKENRPFTSWAEVEPYVNSVPGWMLEGQERFLFEKVRSLPDGALILEMGADRGRSTCAMAFACVGTRKRIVSIDSFEGNAGIMGLTHDFRSEWHGNLARLGLDSYATGIKGYTFDVLPGWDRPVDFAFIDASHEYIDVLNDFRLTYPHVKVGGWLAFHDVEPSWPGPWRLWLEYGIPMLTDHQQVATLACGRKSEVRPFRKDPSLVAEFSFARHWIEDLRRSGDPGGIPLLPALQASLDAVRAGAGGLRQALEAERSIAGMAPHLRQILRNMITKDAFFDGYLRYWNGLALEAEGRSEEARKEFRDASRVSYPAPMGLLERRLGGDDLSGSGPPAEIFLPHVGSGDIVLQVACGDGALLRDLPGRLKLGLEANDQARKKASLEAGIDSYNTPGELPDAFADVVIGAEGALASERDPLGLLNILRAKLKPSGKAVFTAAMPDADASTGALYAWTPSAFGNLFRAAGFAVEEVGVATPREGRKSIRLVARPARCGEGKPEKPADWVMAAPSVSGSAVPSGPDPRDIPVALVVYRRPEHTRKVLESLERHGIRNLCIFSDAPKGNGDEEDVRETRRLIESIRWTRPEIHEAESNRGLAKSIMAATDHVFGRHEHIVVLEDDCVPHRHFFDFVSSCLGRYADDEKVFGVSGYSVPLTGAIRDRYPYDAWFCPRIGSWGWATWKRAWNLLERDLLAACRKVLDARIDLAQGGTDIPPMLEGILQGHVKDVWTMNWVLTVYLNRGYYVYPTVSHIDNIGMDGTGVHCGKTDKYETELAEGPARRFPDRVFLDPEVMARFRSFYDLVPQGSGR